MSKIIISFIIDADIARSSGFSEHPVSSGSRKLLENLKQSNHKAAMCPKLMEEWRIHKSLFSAKWLASMVAKKRIVFIKPAKKINNFIEKNIEFCKDKEIALKDSHLVDAALAVDKVIASNDNKARNAFCNLSNKNVEIETVSWFNPVTDSAFIYEFFISGGFIPKKYYLNAENLV